LEEISFFLLEITRDLRPLNYSVSLESNFSLFPPFSHWRKPIVIRNLEDKMMTTVRARSTAANNVSAEELAAHLYLTYISKLPYPWPKHVRMEYLRKYGTFISRKTYHLVKYLLTLEENGDLSEIESRLVFWRVTGNARLKEVDAALSRAKETFSSPATWLVGSSEECESKIAAATAKIADLKEERRRLLGLRVVEVVLPKLDWVVGVPRTLAEAKTRFHAVSRAIGELKTAPWLRVYHELGCYVGEHGCPIVENQLWQRYRRVFESCDLTSSQVRLSNGKWLRFSTPLLTTQKDANKAYIAAFERLLADGLAASRSEDPVKAKKRFQATHRREKFLQLLVDPEGLRPRVLHAATQNRRLWWDTVRNDPGFAQVSV
jgi:hypothetical protein